MLSEDQVKWIVNAKLEGKLTNREIASLQGVSTRRVQKLYSEYKSTGVIHVQKKAGRHKQPLPEQVKYEIIKLYKMYRANASYIGKILRAKDTTLTTTGAIKYSRSLALQRASLKSGTERSG